MKIKTQANIAMLVTGAMILLSISFGYHSYRAAERSVVSDLNQALQRTVILNSSLWTSADSMQTYERLTSIFGSSVVVESNNKTFASALQIPMLHKHAKMLILIRQKQKDLQQPIVPTNKSNYFSSDTILWLASATHSIQGSAKKIGVSFQGSTCCTPLMIFSLSDMRLPLIFLIIGIAAGCFAYRFRRLDKPQTNFQHVSDKQNSITVGNLSLDYTSQCFFYGENEKLKLTPQQFSLMQLFFEAPAHILNRTEIHNELWPKKDNADESLNTLMRRIRPVIEANTNLRISTDRGRAYCLEIKS